MARSHAKGFPGRFTIFKKDGLCRAKKDIVFIRVHGATRVVETQISEIWISDRL